MERRTFDDFPLKLSLDVEGHARRAEPDCEPGAWVVDDMRVYWNGKDITEWISPSEFQELAAVFVDECRP